MPASFNNLLIHDSWPVIIKPAQAVRNCDWRGADVAASMIAALRPVVTVESQCRRIFDEYSLVFWPGRRRSRIARDG